MLTAYYWLMSALKTFEDIFILRVVGSSMVPLTSLLMPFTGPKGLVVHLDGLTGLAKGRL